MNPRLVAIAGPLQGKTFPLRGKDLSIGRDDSNVVCVRDFSVSRKHCVIQKAGEEQFRIFDLDSHNGICVNGIPTKERDLQHGDRIELGDSLFLFLVRESESSDLATDVADLDSSSFTARSTVRLDLKDARYFNVERVLGKDALNPITHGLNVLFKVTKAIHSIRTLEPLARQLLELIFEAIPAQHGAILFLAQDEEIASIYTHLRNPGTDEAPQLSRTVIQEVVRERSAMLSNDILQDETTQKARSLIDSKITSVLAVPLLIPGKVTGVLYLDTTDPRASFNEDQLHLVTAISAIAAVAIENTRNMEWLVRENQRLKQDVKIEHSMVGESPAMQKVYEFIARVAPTNATVLINGESGTGKELAARAIHENSQRSDQPFVVINCATLTESLLESELFGYEKGAFTGAMEERKGKLEVADGGTVFLDEIGEVPLAFQVKLLRVLQEREFDRVGGTKPVHVDLRFIAATNRDLEGAIEAKMFRSDLYYRLNVVNVKMPSLRERKEDIPLLATYFLSKFSKKPKGDIAGISPDARTILLNYSWPGNVRELENAIERAVVMTLSDAILPEDLPETILETSERPMPQYHQALLEAKRQIILKALEESGNNYTEAAKLLGIHPNNLHRLIRNLNLKSRKG